MIKKKNFHLKIKLRQPNIFWVKNIILLPILNKIILHYILLTWEIMKSLSSNKNN
jgi:hypothetical protein